MKIKLSDKGSIAAKVKLSTANAKVFLDKKIVTTISNGFDYTLNFSFQ